MFRKEAMFCSDVFELVSYLFLSGPVHTVQLVSYHSIFYHPETKEMIYESVNLKGPVYSQKKTLSASVYHHLYRFCKCWPDPL